MEQLQANLASFGATRLGDDHALNYSELITFLSLVINAGSALPFAFPMYTAPIAKDIANTFKQIAKYPQGHLGQYLSRYQILFGEYIQFQGNTHDDVYFGAMLSNI